MTLPIVLANRFASKKPTGMTNVSMRHVSRLRAIRYEYGLPPFENEAAKLFAIFRIFLFLFSDLWVSPKKISKFLASKSSSCVTIMWALT